MIGVRDGSAFEKEAPVAGARRAGRSLLAALALAALAVVGTGAGNALADAVPPYGWASSTLADGIDLACAAALGPGDIYAAGTVPSAPCRGRVCHFDGGSWKSLRDTPGRRLNAVAALDSSHVWAAGEAGLMLFYNGVSWAEQPLPSPGTVNGLSALDSSHVWAVGEGGKVFFFDGRRWSGDTPLPGRSLQSVFALDAEHVWAAGARGTILAWDGRAWLDQSVGGPDTLRGVGALDAEHVWAAGDRGAVKYYDGRSWADFSAGVNESLGDIAVLDGDHVFAAGETGGVYFLDGDTWKMTKTGASSPLRSVAVLDTDHVYACGDAGVFLHGYSMLEARHTTFYFAEGSCRPGFDPYICVQNPRPTAVARVRITYMCGNGASVGQSLSVPGSSRATVAVKEKLGSGEDAAHDFSAKVECTNGAAIIAERPMYFSYRSARGVIVTGGSDVVGALRPASTFYFAEGSCRPGFDPYICVLNPGGSDARVKIVYMTGDGSTRDSTLVVKARSRGTVAVKDCLGSGDDAAHDFSAKVQAADGKGIVAERAMYFSYDGLAGGPVTGGHGVVGAAAPGRSFYFAEGSCRADFDSYICVQNPGSRAADVRITYMKGDGGSEARDIVVPARSRRTVTVKEVLGSGEGEGHDFSAKVEALGGSRIIAERPMYFRYHGESGARLTGGHDVVGARYPAGAFYFAEGSCRANFESYLCIQNPGRTDVPVRLTFMKGDGTVVDRDLVVARNSRKTVAVKDVLGRGNDAAHDFSVSVCSSSLDFDGVIVERPVYFDYRSAAGSAITGGHDVVGYSP